jgi:hypothetical protein
MLRSYPKMCNCTIKKGILWQEGSRALVNRNSVWTDRICRINPGKFIALEEPVSMLGCCSMLECRGIMCQACESMCVINNAEIGG